MSSTTPSRLLNVVGYVAATTVVLILINTAINVTLALEVLILVSCALAMVAICQRLPCLLGPFLTAQLARSCYLAAASVGLAVALWQGSSADESPFLGMLGEELSMSQEAYHSAGWFLALATLLTAFEMVQLVETADYAVGMWLGEEEEENAVVVSVV